MEHGPRIPQVTERDILAILPEDIADPCHKERWYRFARAHPALAVEVLKRSNIEAHSPHEAQKRSIDIATFVVDALESALRRHYSEGKRGGAFNDGDDGGADRRLSA